MKNNIIRLQLVDGNFYPLDLVSLNALEDYYHVEKFPEHRFDTISPQLVKRGYKFAVAGYEPKVYEPQPPFGEKVGGKPVSFKNPCVKCYLKEVCGDYCSRR